MVSPGDVDDEGDVDVADADVSGRDEVAGGFTVDAQPDRTTRPPMIPKAQ